MRYRACVDLTYPDAASLPAVRAAGGLKVLAAADHEAFTRVQAAMRHVTAGETCDDIPEESVAWMLAQGLLEQHQSSSEAPEESLEASSTSRPRRRVPGATESVSEGG